MPPKKILILMSNTGGGHLASARALKSAFTQRFDDRFQIDIVDLLIEYLPRPLNELPKSYSFLANDATWLWKLLWRAGENPSLVRAVAELVKLLSASTMRHLLIDYQPDLIISVHPLMHEIVAPALKRQRRRIPYVTVVTDLGTIHPLWFHAAVDGCYVPTAVAAQQAYAAGLARERVHPLGLPIRPAFAAPNQDRETLRHQLGLHVDLPAALLVGGGDGIGPVAEIAYELTQRLRVGSQLLGQVVVICGRNRKLHQELASQAWPVPTLIHGFVENMAEWMAASDCLITKAGPGTIAEATICGLPILLSGFIPGQEEGNVPFVVEQGAGRFATEPAQIAEIVTRWFTSEQKQLAKMAACSKELGRPAATMQIVESIATLVK